MDISGKAVVVAGGAGSLGSAIVADLLRRKALVAIFDTRPEVPGLSKRDTFFAQADAADEDAVAAALEATVATYGKIWALVNCAGLIHSESLVNLLDPGQRRHRLSSWNDVLRSNLTATFVLSAQVAEHMLSSRTKGVIVNFSSIAAGGNAGQTAYAAAKAGIEAMTAVWARELGPLGVRVVAIAPGFVDTPSTHAALREDELDALKRRTPLRRLATTEEIAATVAFAIENDFLTGHTIAVDGGIAI